MTLLQRKIINISVPPVLQKQIDKVAREENKSVSELFRHAFALYMRHKTWTKIRTIGEETALRFGIESYDDVERIAG